MKFFLTCLKWSFKIGGPILLWALASDFLMSYLPAGAQPIFNVASPLVGVVLCFVLSFIIPSMRSYPMAAFGLVAGWYALSTLWSTSDWYSGQRAAGVPVSALMTMDVLVGVVVCLMTLLGGAAGFVFAFPKLAGALRTRAFSLFLNNAHAGKAKRTNSNFYGSAALLTIEDAKRLTKAGPGLVVGQFGQRPKAPLVTDPLQGHFLVCATTGEGKGTGFIGTNLLAMENNGWPGPIVILDPQGESVFIAAEYRSKFRKQVLFDPTDTVAEQAAGRSEYFTPTPMFCNPLDPQYIRRDRRMINDLKYLLEGLVPVPPQTKDVHFYTGARRLIGGVIAKVITTMDPGYHNLAFVRKVISQKHEDIEKMLEEMVADETVAFGYTKACAAFILNIGPNERGSMYSTATNALDWLDDPLFLDHVSRPAPLPGEEDELIFSLSEVLENKADLYIVCPPSSLKSANTWVRMWFSILLGMAQWKKPKERILMIIDEAPEVGRMTPVVRAFRIARKNKLSVVVITQTLSDLISEYGKDDVDSMLRNAEGCLFYGISTMDDTLPEKIEKISGTATWEVESDSDNEGASGKATDVLHNHSQSSGTSRKLEKRAVLTASDVRQLDPNKVIFVNRSKIAKGIMVLDQAPYFKRKETKDKAGLNPYFVEEDQEDGTSIPTSGATKEAA
jgi:type IV secretion system protein VirD4